MKGKFYALGIGPGDPELITLKAVRILKSVDVVCVPKGKKTGESIALSIVNKVVPLKGRKLMEVHFPMAKGSQRKALKPVAEEVMKVLGKGKDIAFITLGDPVFYSTFFHLYDAMLGLDADINIVIVPGVSSINAAGARANMCLSLSGEKIAILPAAYINDLRKILADFDTVVLMKVHSVLNAVRKVLFEMGMLDRAVYVSRVGMAGEMIKPLKEVISEDINYFSTVIVRTRDG